MKIDPLNYKITILILLCSVLINLPAIGQSEVSPELEVLLEEANQLKGSGDLIGLSRHYNKIGFIYWSNQAPEKAIEFFQNALQINQELGNLNAIANLHNYLGLILTESNQYNPALEHFQKALKIFRQQNNTKGIYSELINLAITYQELTSYQNAINILDDALIIAKELNDLKLLRRSYGLLAETHEKAGHASQSMDYYQTFLSLDKEIQQQEITQREKMADQQINQARLEKDQANQDRVKTEKKLQNTETELNAALWESQQRQMKIELLDQENQIKELRVKEQESALKQAALVRNSFIAGLTLVLSLATVVLIAYRQKKKDNQLLTQQNREISQQKERILAQSLEIAKAYNDVHEKNTRIKRSINYAKRIQDSMLCQGNKMKEAFPDSMIYLRPRDIVSGDFHYFKKLHHKGDLFAVGAIDCTGHGVPGAFMSMIANELLYEIFDLKKRYHPDQVLSELHTGIHHALKQDETQNRDGMDMALTLYDPTHRVLEYAGARNPLIYITDQQLYQVKANRTSIGGFPYQPQKTFKRHMIPIKQPTTVYLFSDGFQDQFGGPEGDKFLLKNFKNLLLEIHCQDWESQAAQLDHALNNWKSDQYPQIDDILVIGFRVG